MTLCGFAVNPQPPLLKWCQNLLQLDCDSCSCFMPLPLGGFPGINHHYVQMAFGNSTCGAGQRQWAHQWLGSGKAMEPAHRYWQQYAHHFNLMCQAGFVLNICCTRLAQAKALAGFTFYDNMDLCILGQSESKDTIAKLMQQSVTTWEVLLQATGGALVPSKCCWYLIDLSGFVVLGNMGQAITQGPGTDKWCARMVYHDWPSGTTWQTNLGGLASSQWKLSGGAVPSAHSCGGVDKKDGASKNQPQWCFVQFLKMSCFINWCC